jgi:hypothetical protein
LAVVTHDSRYGAELITVGPLGEDPQPMVAEPAYVSIGDRPSWSADGGSVALSVSVDSDYEPPARFGSGLPVLGIARADGSLRVFPRVFLNGGDPVMAPDGRSVVFARIALVKVLPGRESYLFKSSLRSFRFKNRSLRRLTPWRLARSVTPSSFAPDGTKIAATSFDRRGLRAVEIDLRTGRFSLLARQAMEPSYSADGSRLAFVRRKIQYNDLPEPNRPISELWVADADGGSAQRLLRRRGFIEFPSWDPSNARLAFAPNPPDFTGSLEREPGNELMAINADGTCLTRVFADPDLTLYGAAWRPGAGREAGPISC